MYGSTEFSEHFLFLILIAMSTNILSPILILNQDHSLKFDLEPSLPILNAESLLLKKKKNLVSLSGHPHLLVNMSNLPLKKLSWVFG